jgi:hypothetical protein
VEILYHGVHLELLALKVQEKELLLLHNLQQKKLLYKQANMV